jgi:hypothetical protein
MLESLRDSTADGGVAAGMVQISAARSNDGGTGSGATVVRDRHV